MIKIRETYKYFTHLPGKESVIPLSCIKVRAYPCKIIIENIEVVLNITGPIKGFTHLLNIEKARVEVFGKGEEGYFHLHLFAKKGQILLKLHRGENISLTISQKEKNLIKGEVLPLFETNTIDLPQRKEKISFGCFKKPLLEKGVDRKTKLFSLCQLMPKTSSAQVELSQIEPLLKDLFSPQTEDVDYQGISIPGEPFSPFALFAPFYQQMRASILLETEDTITILGGGKKLPIAGRATNFACKECSIDILWRKGRALKLTITPFKDVEKRLLFPGNAKSFRIKQRPNDKGTILTHSSLLVLKAGQTLFIDNITY
ncbi:MAG: hypothetical protein SP4CHLAM5_00570 [Chlamydiia bacterium]|nr:hypothetical protein [Chlamydiia bacterium]MCH9617934.1 hypothetical protein [Chlamydiia bacterium]MCH9624587.1 hypothetical protein [Chlamydiia bacterium]